MPRMLHLRVGMRQSHYYRPVHQALLVVGVTVFLIAMIAALYAVRMIALASLIGVGVGALIAPVGRSFQRRYRIPRPVTSFFLLIGGLGAFLLVGYFMVNMISDQIVPVVQKMPDLLHKMSGKFSEFSGQHPWFTKSGKNVDPGKYFSGIGAAVFSGVRLGAGLVTGLVFMFFVALYLSIKTEAYLDGFVSAFPAHMRVKTRSVMVDSAHSLRGWFGAQLTAMSIVAVIAAVVLKTVGSPYWLFFGATTFVLELIPYIGPITAFVTVCAITAASDPSSFVKTALAFLIVLALEGHVVVPLVMKGKVNLPPVHLLILMAIMGEWFGVFGFLMTAPLLAVLRTVYLSAYVPRMNRQTVPPSEESEGPQTLQKAA
jgi:predicted PurR-regulated permease PerM